MNDDDGKYVVDVLAAFTILEASPDLTADEQRGLAKLREWDVKVGRRALTYRLVMPPRLASGCLHQG